jgi:hypothetical protein
MQFFLEPLYLRLEILKVVAGNFLPFDRVIAHANYLGCLAVGALWIREVALRFVD